MDKEKHIGGSRLLDQEIKKYKIKIKEGSVKREHINSDFLKDWDAVEKNAIRVNDLQKLVNAYYLTMQNAIYFEGDTDVIEEGIENTVNFTLKVYGEITDDVPMQIYRNGVKDPLTVRIPRSVLQNGGAYTWSEVFTENVLYKIEVTVGNNTYVGLWQLGNENYSTYTNSVYDKSMTKTQDDINSDFESRLLALEIGNVSITVSLTGGGVKEYTGDRVSFAMDVKVKFNNSTTFPSGVTPSWSMSGHGCTDSGTSASATVYTSQTGSAQAGENSYTYTLNGEFTYKGHRFTGSSTTTFYIVKRSYIGFSTDTDYSEGMELDNTASAVTRNMANSSYTLTHTGLKYLWIITPHTINSVSTDSSGNYPVACTLKGSANGLYYYRSNDLIDDGTLTFYIH